MAITTGARRGELVALTWGDINLERRVALVQSSKNGEPRVLPLVPAAVDELARFQRDRGGPAHSSLRHAGPIASRGSSIPSWLAALARAGIEKFRFHDLRHTFASYLAQEGASLLEIAEAMGHRSS
jgi:integrase